MTNEQYESLRHHILDLKFEVSELRMLIKQVIEEQKRMQRRVDPEAESYLDSIAEIEIPDDLKKFFGG